MSLIELEQTLRESIESEADLLTKLSEAIRLTSPLSKSGTDITKTILLRMKSYYEGQRKVKELLNKRYLSAASDFFVESILFYLKLFCEFYAKDLEVHSERQVKKKRGAIRPDISVWHGDEVIGIIECKTQLGWSRQKWEIDFNQREKALRVDFPHARTYLLVMSSVNWAGFKEGDGRIGHQFFTLSSLWPNNITRDHSEEVIVDPVEVLFNSLISGHET